MPLALALITAIQEPGGRLCNILFYIADLHIKGPHMYSACIAEEPGSNSLLQLLVEGVHLPPAVDLLVSLIILMYNQVSCIH